ncbi:TPA: hypothetical protein SOL94_001696, partial [Clostridioides difficile]|nr:hypothetical protein [Clostridioides difficile]
LIDREHKRLNEEYPEPKSSIEIKNPNFLNTVKCDVGQGFYFSKPIEEKEFFNKYVTKK